LLHDEGTPANKRSHTRNIKSTADAAAAQTCSCHTDSNSCELAHHLLMQPSRSQRNSSPLSNIRASPPICFSKTDALHPLICRSLKVLLSLFKAVQS
jgi:hypothetical protein